MRFFEFSDGDWGALKAYLEIERDEANDSGLPLTIPIVNLKKYGVSDPDSLVQIKNKIDPNDKLFKVGKSEIFLKTKSSNPDAQTPPSGKGFSVDDMASSAAKKAISQK